jgi:hypothetical protein
MATSESIQGRGRPTAYTEPLAEEICRRLAGGESLRAICRAAHMPDDSTVRAWVLDNREGFSPRYARARELQAEAWADEIIDIADDGSNDWMERNRQDGDAEKVLDHEHVTRSRLRVDTRKWLLAKLKPGTYGERTTVAGDPAAPLYTAAVTGLPDPTP